MVSDSFVCRQHELFNQAMGEIAFGARNGLHQAEFVELDHWLGKIEVDRSAALALAVQDLRQIAHQFECRDQRSVTLAQRLVAFQNGVHIGVGHALGGADYAFAQVVSDNLAAVIDLHNA